MSAEACLDPLVLERQPGILLPGGCILVCGDCCIPSIPCPLRQVSPEHAPS